MFGFLLTVLSALFAVLPMLAFLLAMWWLDRYDREPIWLVGLTFLWGAVGAVFLALIGNFVGFTTLTWVFGQETADMAAPVFIAPLVEEPVKAVVLFLVARSRSFDNTTDGFVYGAAAGLGFGMTENFFYFSSVGATGDLAVWVQTVVIRTLYSALMHAGATSCVGAALGWARLRGNRMRWLALPIGFALAMSMHALWNGMLTLDYTAEMNGALTVVNLAVFPLEFLTLVVVFQVCLALEKRTLAEELSAEAQEGTLPAEHVPVITSFLRRGTRGWLAAGVPHHPYVHATTTLAFRRAQARRARPDERAWYDRELARLRQEVSGLLGQARPAQAPALASLGPRSPTPPRTAP